MYAPHQHQLQLLPALRRVLMHIKRQIPQTFLVRKPEILTGLGLVQGFDVLQPHMAAPLTQEIFPEGCKVRVVPSGDGKPPSNFLLLLHGLGDNADNFAQFGQRLNLSETQVVAIQAPTPLPFDLGGFHWGDDIVFDQASGQMDLDTGFQNATRLVERDVIQHVLLEKCKIKPRQIVMFGNGQGGMVALHVARKMRSLELGGIVSLGGPLPNSPTDASTTTSKTPVMVVHGSSKSMISIGKATQIKSTFDNAAFHQWKRPGDGMPTSREEVVPIMQFLAGRLRSQAGVPSGAHEIS